MDRRRMGRAVTAVDELVAYVRQQLDAEDGLARRVAERYTIRNPDRADDGQPYWPLPSVEASFRGRIDPDIVAGLDLIRTYDPARVLAEVEAKRRILDLHEPQRRRLAIVPEDGNGTITLGFYVCPICLPSTIEHGQEFDEGPCPTVRLLAQPYAGRDGWREEWAT